MDRPAGPGQSYSSPPSNPFVGASPGRDEIFALGLRNPFRFSFDRATGEIWLGDVGQDTIEEIDVITAGGNCGWRVFEGLGPIDASACEGVASRPSGGGRRGPDPI